MLQALLNFSFQSFNDESFNIQDFDPFEYLLLCQNESLRISKVNEIYKENPLINVLI